MGEFFGATFLPRMKGLIEATLSYEDVKRLLKIPARWGAKLGGEQFLERAKVTKKRCGKATSWLDRSTP